jgi:hypothetical protein
VRALPGPEVLGALDPGDGERVRYGRDRPAGDDVGVVDVRTRDDHVRVLYAGFRQRVEVATVALDSQYVDGVVERLHAAPVDVDDDYVVRVGETLRDARTDLSRTDDDHAHGRSPDAAVMPHTFRALREEDFPFSGPITAPCART